MLEYLSTKHIAYLPQVSAYERSLSIAERQTRTVSWPGKLSLTLNSKGEIWTTKYGQAPYLLEVNYPIVGLHHFGKSILFWDTMGQVYLGIFTLPTAKLNVKLYLQFKHTVVQSLKYGEEGCAFILADGSLHVYQGSEYKPCFPGGYRSLHRWGGGFGVVTLKDELYRYLPDHSLDLKAQDVVHVAGNGQGMTWIDRQGRWYSDGKLREVMIAVPIALIISAYGSRTLLYADGEIRFEVCNGNEYQGTFPGAVAINISYGNCISYYTVDNQCITLGACGDGRLRPL
jgi:hypothetical protein